MQQQAINQDNNICSSEIFMYLFFVFLICYYLYNMLSKKTINIENFDSIKKITYSLDGHEVTYNQDENI